MWSSQKNAILLFLFVIREECRANVVALNKSPIVEESETTSLTCADISESPNAASLFIRRLFTWSGSSTTVESDTTKQIMNGTGTMDTWAGTSSSKAIGAFSCGRGDDTVSTVKIHADGSLIPHLFTKLAVVGSKAVIKMNLATVKSSTLRKVTWYKARHIIDTRGTPRMWETGSGRSLVISNVSINDAGVYMAHHSDEDRLYAAGTVLIVRRCLLNRWGSDCKQSCPLCLHGGVCNEKTGLCVCPPGFIGDLCERSCSPSYFGNDCKHSCTSIAESEEGSTCKGIQYCSVMGCACMSGWMGVNCNQPCGRGAYGASCRQACRCYHGGTCDRFHGCVCTSNYTGPTCKILKTDLSRVKEPSPTLRTRMQTSKSSSQERKPVITDVKAIPSFRVNEGEKVEIQCSATGVPSPQHGDIMLKRPNKIIPPTQSKMSEYLTTSYFSFIMKSYAGPFWCVATTSAGIAQKEFNFTIPVLPTPVEKPELMIKEATFLKLKLNSLNFTGDGPIVKTALLWKATGKSSYKIHPTNNRDDTVEVRNLIPYTNYTFRVLLYREGPGGRGPPGPTADFRTDCGYPSSPPTIKNVHASNNTIMHLSWTLPPPKEIKGEILGYKIYYRVLGESSAWKTVILEYKSRIKTAIKNLIPLAVYRVKIRLYNCAGDSDDSKEVRVTMGRLKKPAGPEVTLVNQTSRSLVFKWLPPTNAKPYTISGYEVLLKELGNTSPNKIHTIRNVSGLYYSGNSLIPFTQYQFKVRAYNHEGPGNYSNELNVTTEEEAPGMPSNFRESRKTPDSITLSWDEPIHPNGIIRNYIVNKSANEENWEQFQTLGTENEITILELAEYTNYYFRIRAMTIDGGEWSDVLEAKTMSLSPLQPPQRIDVSSPSPQSVLIKWSPPPKSQYVEDIKQYKIIYTDDLRQRTEHWKEWIVNGDKRMEEIISLRSDYVYLFAMAAVTQQAGPYSVKKTIRTQRLGLPPPPKDVYITNVTSNSAIVRWRVEKGYSITKVQVRVKSANTLKWHETFHQADQEKATLQLLPGTKYNIELYAANHNGYSSGNPLLNFQTLTEKGAFDGYLLKIVVPAICGVAVFAFIIIVCIKCRRRSHDSLNRTPLELDRMLNHNRASTIGSAFQLGTMNSRSGTLLSRHSFQSRNSREPGMLYLPESLNICWENIFFENITLGEGNFGQVVKAVVQRNDKLIQVAVKMLKDGCSADDRKDFLAELDMMVRLGEHQNIISFIGACEHDSCLYLCTEYAPNGNLLQFLRKSRHAGIDGTYTTLTQEQLLQFALDVCQGMAYLCDKQLIHRDLAARNILLSGNLTCKVADFGLSRGEGVYVKKTVARLPIRWMAIESLNYNVYTTKSDVWSFGVLLWEIVSLGGTPYYGMSCAELYEKLPRGYRMEQPLNCDGEVYKLMSQCWKDRPYDRPSFSQLCVALGRMVDARTNRNYVNTAIFENFMLATIDANEEEG